MRRWIWLTYGNYKMPLKVDVSKIVAVLSLRKSEQNPCGCDVSCGADRWLVIEAADWVLEEIDHIERMTVDDYLAYDEARKAACTSSDEKTTAKS